MNTKKLYKSVLASVIFISVNSPGFCQQKEARLNYKSFTVNAMNKKVAIDWVTDNKVPTNYFEIQRSTDGKNFKTIAMVLGPDPEKQNCDCYECFDKLSGTKQTYFYRLKHVGTDGEVDISETKMLALK